MNDELCMINIRERKKPLTTNISTLVRERENNIFSGGCLALYPNVAVGRLLTAVSKSYPARCLLDSN